MVECGWYAVCIHCVQHLLLLLSQETGFGQERLHWDFSHLENVFRVRMLHGRIPNLCLISYYFGSRGSLQFAVDVTAWNFDFWVWFRLFFEPYSLTLSKNLEFNPLKMSYCKTGLLSQILNVPSNSKQCCIVGNVCLHHDQNNASIFREMVLVSVHVVKNLFRVKSQHNAHEFRIVPVADQLFVSWEVS